MKVNLYWELYFCLLFLYRLRYGLLPILRVKLLVLTSSQGHLQVLQIIEKEVNFHFKTKKGCKSRYDWFVHMFVTLQWDENRRNLLPHYRCWLPVYMYFSCTDPEFFLVGEGGKNNYLYSTVMYCSLEFIIIYIYYMYCINVGPKY